MNHLSCGPDTTSHVADPAAATKLLRGGLLVRPQCHITRVHLLPALAHKKWHCVLATCMSSDYVAPGCRLASFMARHTVSWPLCLVADLLSA